MKRDWKAEAVKQWNDDPCGADRQTEFATAEFFQRVEHERYVDYAPWMKAAIGFDRYSGKRVLEVGFGLGTDHVSFARGGASCFGIDLTPAHLAATRRRLEIETFRPRLSQADAEILPFAEGSFDAVYSFGVLHHTPNTQGAINEIHRVLKPDGEAIIGLYHRDSAFYWGFCVLTAGILNAGFFRDGYRKTLSRVEKRENSDAVPLVKVYSVRQARRLFSRFTSVRTEIRHFDLGHAGIPGQVLRRLLGTRADQWSRRFGQRFGWYVIVRARK